jgi:chromosome segregation ATPase
MIMANQKNELEQVELELSELRSHLEQSFGVLDGLAQVQARFEELARTYQDFKARVGEAGAVLGTVTQQQQKLEQRFSSLEQEISSGWSEIRKELSQIRGEVGEGDRQLNQSITEQVIHLQRLEERFGDVSRNLTNQRDEISTELSRAHEALRNQVEEAKANLETFVQTQGGSDQRLAELEKLIEASWKQARNELLQAQEELSTADRTLSSEMVKQINGLKREVEGRLGTILQEWMNQREAMRAPRI